jgi:hypothetical protein
MVRVSFVVVSGGLPSGIGNVAKFIGDKYNIGGRGHEFAWRKK